ncbi:MAG: ABC transporter ATP-binding protein/permease [Clostridiales bacterium]|nr:ABC transporter ATP-binding protein/permease [Clostridiales bacterium]MDD7309470.1 ABC transporter ATP-binding protein [Eubacteriales bacterium]MDY5346559.1 ABC transporter ATP-binding protein [Eubacteriales bacterium]
MRCKDIILDYFKKHWLRYAFGVVFVILATIFNAILPQLLGKTIDLVKAARDPAQSATLRDVRNICLLMCACAVAAFLTRNIWRYLIMGFTRSIELHLRHALFSHLQVLSPEFYVKNNTGDIITRAIIDSQAIRMMFGMGLIGIVDVLTINVVTLGYMVSTTSLKLTAIAVIPLPFLLFALVKLRTAMRRRFMIVQHSVSDIAAKVQENLTGIRVIKAFAQEDSENKQFEALSRKKWKAEMDMIRVWSFINPLSALVFGSIFAVFLYFGGKMVIAGTLTLGEFVAFNTYIALLMDPISRISRIIQIWQRGLVSMQRLDMIFSAKPAIDDAQADPAITTLAPLSIDITNLSYRYPGTEKDVLKNISFHLETGGTLAIMGATGSGKSTLMSLLMRMWNPPADAISVSGHPIETVPLSVLRGSIAYVPQESFLFSDSILNNIIFYDERITEDDAKAAAKAAAIHDNICEFPDQYATTVGERGMTLSGGQKQRVSIARALARKPELLLLDDCLSAVDAETERTILANLRDYLKGCTTIIVTHRIAVAGIADRVLLLNEDGSMAAIGTHSELSANCPEYQHLLAILEASKDGAAK